jgi:NhaP-type Na+/H+ or K+/H+ antiporter/K+/H+ antiporter YhaU regulatory subunit KhtT
VSGAAPLVVGESGGASLLTVVATIIGVGVLSQVLADRLQVPSVVFLIAAGLVLGPGIGVLKPDQLFGSEPIATIVGVSVAIIVFEGAFNLRVSKLQEAPSETVRLITVGAVIAFLGTATTVHFVLGAGWPLSLLIGALLVATGPTVVTPILDVVPVRDRVAAALETEGIVNDVTAAIGAVVAFEAIRLENPTVADLARLFAERLGIGVLVGIVVAGVLYYLLQYIDLSPGSAPQNARLLVLAGAVVAFGAAQELASEAGVAAAATAGIVLGNLDVPYDHQIEAFNGDLTLLVLSFVFITLAALLDLQSLSELGAGGLIVVAVAALVLRPLLVFLSTIGDRYATSEKLFISLVGPRGIIPASVATLFALGLDPADVAPIQGGLLTPNLDPSGVLVGTVFLVILVTVVLEGGFARQIAELLDVIPMRVIIIGGGSVGRALAKRLEDRGENVVIVERDAAVVERARNDGFTVHVGDGTDTDDLLAAGGDNSKIVTAATGDDDANLLIAQLAKSEFAPETVIARVNDPDKVDAFEDLGVQTVSSTFATATAIDNMIERPTLSNWMTEVGRAGDVQETALTADEFVGLTIREFDQEIPTGVLIALVGRNGDNHIPDADFTLRRGDRLTLLGDKQAVREAMRRCQAGSASA